MGRRHLLGRPCRRHTRRSGKTLSRADCRRPTRLRASSPNMSPRLATLMNYRDSWFARSGPSSNRAIAGRGAENRPWDDRGGRRRRPVRPRGSEAASTRGGSPEVGGRTARSATTANPPGAASTPAPARGGRRRHPCARIGRSPELLLRRRRPGRWVATWLRMAGRGWAPLDRNTRSVRGRDREGCFTAAEKHLQSVEQSQVISLSIVSAPSRPRAFDKFATVIHHDIRRPDAPDHCLANGRGFSVGYTSWQNLASYCGGEWFPGS